MVAFARMNLGLASQFMGNLEVARSRLEASIEEIRAIGDSFGHTVGLSYLARTLEQEGRWTEAEAALGQAIEIFQQKSMPT
jgi:tetratricopeptide (TPR) repeat protein